MKRILLIIIDGLGDRPIPQLGNKTPLEAAKTPNLGFLAQNGVCGLVLPFLLTGQKKPASDTCHLALFGYNPYKYYLGRGVYEAAGIGMKLNKGDVALRVNFATINPKSLKIIDRRAGRIEKTQPLVKSLSGITIEGIKFLIKKSWGHRAVLVLRSATSGVAGGVSAISAKVGDGDPKKTGVQPRQILAKDNTNNSKFTARILNKFLEKAHQILKEHPLNKKREKEGKLPANYLLLRGAGKFKKTLSFSKKYNLRACFIAGGALYKGIARVLGMEEILVKGATGFPNTNLKGKFLAAKRALRKVDELRSSPRFASARVYNFVFLHIKASDNLAEDGNFLGKKEFIEKIDKNLKPILRLKNTLIIVTADHSTCSLFKRHCQELIPLLIYGEAKDEVQKFSEKSCRKGKLGKFRQLDLMPKILRFSKK